MPSPFDVVPDPVSRNAFKESFETGAYTSVLGEGYAPPSGMDPNPGFPPEPAELLSINAAYLRDDAPGGVKKEFIALSSTLPSTRAATNMYRSSVDARHRAMPHLLRLTAGIPELRDQRNMSNFYMDAVRGRRLHLLAAHMIAKNARDGSLVDALVLPKSMSEQIPLLIRDDLVAKGEFNSDDAKMRLVLQSDETTREPAAIVAANFLPNVSLFRRALENTRAFRRSRSR